MKKEVSKVIEKKATIVDIMEKYGAIFSIQLSDGFAHLSFRDNGEMYVTLLNDEGYVEEEGQPLPFTSIEKVTNFMREMKELRLPEYQKTSKN